MGDNGKEGRVDLPVPRATANEKASSVGVGEIITQVLRSTPNNLRGYFGDCRTIKRGVDLHLPYQAHVDEVTKGPDVTKTREAAKRL